MMPSGASGKLAYLASIGLVAASLSFDAGTLAPGDLPLLTQDKSEWVVDHVTVRAKHPFSCDITNNDSRPVKVLGTPGCCRREGCIEFLDPPATILAHESRTFFFDFVARQAGPFEVTAKIFLESADKGGIVVPVTLRGIVNDLDE